MAMGATDVATRTLPGRGRSAPPSLRLVRSGDGTPIARWVAGDGPPLILVHGTGATAAAWDQVLPYLTPWFTLHVVERRGRRPSGDGPDYSLAREGEDLAAVAASIGGTVDVLAHSYGAACTLEASLRTSNLGRLVLYEPPIERRHDRQRMRRLARLAHGRERLVTAGRLVSPAVEAGTGWPVRPSGGDPGLVLARTVLREARADARYRVSAERFGEMRAPTLVLVGSETEPDFKRGAACVLDALPNARLQVLPGQGHVALSTAPRMLARHVLRFLRGVPGSA